MNTGILIWTVSFGFNLLIWLDFRNHLSVCDKDDKDDGDEDDNDYPSVTADLPLAELGPL